MSKEQDIKKHIARTPSMVKKFVKIYNKMCGRCTQMCITNSARPMTDYCENCQKMMREVLE